MKNLYVCEKCGKMFDNWDDAYNCEFSHQDVDTLWGFNLLPADGQPMPTQFWEDGEVAPSIVVMRHAVLDQDGKTVYKRMPNGRDVAEFVPVMYRRVKAASLPNGLKLADYKEAMDARQLNDNQLEEDSAE